MKLRKIGRAVRGFARQQDIGVLQIGSTEIQQPFPFCAGQQCGDQIGLVVSDPLNHVAVASAALDLEAQTGAQPDEFKQVGGNAAEVAVTVEKRQWRECFIDDYADHRVLRQPAFFAVTELQLVIGEQDVAAGAPTLGDVFSFADRDRHERRIDDTEQFRVVLVHRKTESVGFVFAEVGHADVVQVALVDHVMGRNGIAEKHVRLVEGYGVDRILIGGMGCNDRLRVEGLDLLQRQIVIHHAQAQTGKAVSQ